VFTDTGEQKTISLSPDLLLHFEIETPKKHYRFLPEINLTKLTQKKWRARVRAYCSSLPAYTTRFETTLLTAIPVLVATASDFPIRDVSELKPAELQERRREAKLREYRLQDVVKWTEAELTKLQLAEQLADMFLFTAAPLDQISAFDLFFSPNWVMPFDPTPRPLMEYKRGDDGL
jgi:hypothetical protein